MREKERERERGRGGSVCAFVSIPAVCLLLAASFLLSLLAGGVGQICDLQLVKIQIPGLG